MKTNDTVLFRGQECKIVHEHKNGNFDVAIKGIPVTYEEINEKHLTKL